MDNRDVNKLERSDTENTFYNGDLVEYLQENSSFCQRFNSQDICEILTADTGITVDTIEEIDDDRNRGTNSNWDYIEQLEFNSRTLNDSASPSALVPACSQSGLKKIYRMGDKFVFMENDSDCEDSVDIVQSSPDAMMPVVLLPPQSSAVMESDSNAVVGSSVFPAPSLSLQPWPGSLDFSLKLNSNKHSSNKWCFSTALNKLFVSPGIAVPIGVTVNRWIDAYVNITPVYVDSENQGLSVPRCYVHKKQDETQGIECSDHIVQLENTDAVYKFSNGRHSVDIPLGCPPPGESSRQLLVKLGCWNTCTGGPNRKEFCLVLTLFSSAHSEIGRRIVKLKVCSCPKRDMQTTEAKEGVLRPKSAKKRASPAKKIMLNKNELPLNSSKRIKIEQNEQQQEQQQFQRPTNRHVMVPVPTELEKEVKHFINQLIAERHVKKTSSFLLPFPDL